MHFLFTPCSRTVRNFARVYAVFGQKEPKRILEQKAHLDGVSSVQWAKTCLRFVSGSNDGTALIWRYERQEWRTVQLRMSCSLGGASDATREEPTKIRKVIIARWSCDDRYVITTVSNFSIKVWDSTNGLLHRELKEHEEEAFVLEPHPYDSNVLLSAGHDGRLFIWDMSKGKVIKPFFNTINDESFAELLDAKWNVCGTRIAATDSFGLNESYKKLPEAICSSIRTINH